MQTRMMRSQTDKVVGGVGGGLANYFNIDPVWVRLGFIVLTLTTGIGLLLYIALWLVLPTPSGQSVINGVFNNGTPNLGAMGQQVGQRIENAWNTATQQSTQPHYDPQTGQPLAHPVDPAARNQKLGVVLLGIGTLMLASFLHISGPVIALGVIGAGWYMLRKS